MPKVKAPDQQNIPAFQRKRSLSAKARRVRKPAIALERKEAGIPVVKPPRRRRVVSKRRTEARDLSTFGTSSISSDVYERRERLKARLAAQKSSSSSGGGFGSLSRVENEISSGSGDGGFSAPMVDDYESAGESYSSSLTNSAREMRICGVVDQYFSGVNVAAVVVSSTIRIGDRLVFETQDGLFEQEVESMQIDREDVMTAYNGDDVGLEVVMEPKVGGNVYRVVSG